MYVLLIITIACGTIQEHYYHDRDAALRAGQWWNSYKRNGEPVYSSLVLGNRKLGMSL